MRRDSGEIPIEVPDRHGREKPSQGIFEAERLDITLKRLLEISDRCLLRLPFPVGRNIGNASRESAQLAVWDQLDGNPVHRSLLQILR